VQRQRKENTKGNYFTFEETISHMKKLFLILVFSFSIILVFAQAPEKFNYQGVARDNSGNILANQLLGLRITLHSGSPTGTTVYQEIHSTTTNDFGYFDLQIGAGTVVSGIFNTISWGIDSYYQEIEMDATGGTAYQSMGTTQLISVPYALYSKTSGNSKTYFVLSGDVTDSEAEQRIQNEVGSQTQFIWIMNTTQLTTVNFPELSEIVEIKIENNSSLSSISFTNLTNVWSNFSIYNNTILNSLSIPVLATVYNNLNVLSNSSLTSLSFPALTASGSFSAGGYNSPFTSLNIPVLATVSGSFSVGSSPSLTSLIIPALTTVFGDFTISGNSALTLLYIPVLTTSGSFRVTSNISLSSLSIPLLATISGAGNSDFSVSGNTSLTAFSIPSLTYIYDSHFYAYYNALTSSSVNALLAELVAINPGISGWFIYLGGQTPPAPPTGQGIIDKSILVNNNNVETD
jgi:hypothetical protein